MAGQRATTTTTDFRQKLPNRIAILDAADDHDQAHSLDSYPLTPPDSTPNSPFDPSGMRRTGHPRPSTAATHSNQPQTHTQTDAQKSGSGPGTHLAASLPNPTNSNLAQRLPLLHSSPSPPSPSPDMATAIVLLPPAAQGLLAQGQRPDIPHFSLDTILDKVHIFDPNTGYPLPPKPSDDGTPFAAPSPSKPSDAMEEDGERIPRPENKFILFRRDLLARIASLKLSKAEHTALGMGINDAWKAAPETVKQHYQHLSQLSKEAHALRYPGYKYQPRATAKILEDKQKKREKLEEQKRKAREERRAVGRGSKHSVDAPDTDNEYMANGKVPIPRKYSTSRYGRKLSASGAGIASSSSAAGPRADPPRGGKRISQAYAPYRQASWKYYPPSAFGPDGSALKEEDDAEGMDSDDDSEDERHRPRVKHYAKRQHPQESAPSFQAHAPMYQPPPFLPILPNTQVAPMQQMSYIPTELKPYAPSQPTSHQQPGTIDTNALWPSLEQGVGWSNAGPVYVDGTQWVAQPQVPTPTTAGATGGDVGYANWKTSAEDGPEVQIQLPLPAVPPPGHLDSIVQSLRIAGGDGGIPPSALHTPPTPLDGGGPLDASFANDAMDSFLAHSIQQPGAGPPPEANPVSTFWGDFVASQFARSDMPNGGGVTIQGLSVDDYAFYTGGTGAGALLSAATAATTVNPTSVVYPPAQNGPQPEFFRALGVEIDVDDWDSLRKVVTQPADASWWNPNQNPNQNQDPAEQEGGAADLSFGSMVSYGAGEREVEVEQASSSEPSPPQEVITPVQPAMCSFPPIPSPATVDDSGDELPISRPIIQQQQPPPYKPPSGAKKFAERRVAAKWGPPAQARTPQQRTASMQSVQSSIVHGSDAGTGHVDREYAFPAQPSSVGSGGLRSRQSSATYRLDFNFSNPNPNPTPVADGDRPPPIPLASRPGSSHGGSVSGRSMSGSSVFAARQPSRRKLQAIPMTPTSASSSSRA